ncbi:MAG TPA: hypothetical protein VIL32_17380 [Steroidobacteraceae bacterium]
MEAASRPLLEPLTEAGPELPASPGALHAPPAMPEPSTPARPAAPRAPAAAEPASVAPIMDRDFIVRNQIVERYLSGRLPIKGATEFERFCRENPEALDELGLPERVNAALRLLEAGGKPEPWQEKPKKFWETPYLPIGLGVAVLALAGALMYFVNTSSERASQIEILEKRVAEQPIEPATSTRSVRLLPSRSGASNSPAIIFGGGDTQLADLKLDVSKSPHRRFRITIDRIDQGRVAILHNLQKDSNGHLRLAFNTSALGPGNYQFTIEGITLRGENVPDSWVTIGVRR